MHAYVFHSYQNGGNVAQNELKSLLDHRPSTDALCLLLTEN